MCACRLKLRVVQKFRSSQPEHLFVLEVWRGSILVDRSYTCHRLNGTQWYLSREKAALYSHCALSFWNAYSLRARGQCFHKCVCASCLYLLYDWLSVIRRYINTYDIDTSDETSASLDCLSTTNRPTIQNSNGIKVEGQPPWFKYTGNLSEYSSPIHASEHFHSATR